MWQATSTVLAVLGTYPWRLRSLRVLTTADFDRLTDALDLPPLGEILTADEIARFVVRVAYPTCPVVLVDEELALIAPARAYGDWLGALGLPDLAGKARTRLPRNDRIRRAHRPRRQETAPVRFPAACPAVPRDAQLRLFCGGGIVSGVLDAG
ncbi:hypothetical protein ACH47B_22455 [Rhodococcus sp. NPDC019627]|uniref:Uncharacterized protein n=1 Tax=Rhodococcus opacus (strain B4) TaxID=632772 RepID=C1BDY7_RHOOB|nr:hypothetical protein [Rhodococcus opacus]BAH47190.1 hypothetical protein ROP_pROB02-01830 [Rhodococcus opacus B4]